MPFFILLGKAVLSRGVVLVQAHGVPVIAAMDHNVPSAERLLMDTSCWFQSQLLDSVLPTGEKPTVPFRRRLHMHSFLRGDRESDLTTEVCNRDVRASIEVDYWDVLVDFIVIRVWERCWLRSRLPVVAASPLSFVARAEMCHVDCQ